MNYYFYLFTLALLLFLVILFLRLCKFNLQLNFSLLVFSFLSFLYLYVAPAVSVYNYELNSYIINQVLCIFFFNIPLIFFYVLFQKLQQKNNNRLKFNIKIRVHNIAILKILFFTFTIIFFINIFKTGLFFVRVGSEVRADYAIEAGNSILGIISRIFEKFSFFLIDIIFLSIIFKSKKDMYDILFYFALLLYVLYILVNSKLNLIILAFNLIIIYVFKQNILKLKILHFKKIIFIFSFFYYSYVVSSNFRADYLSSQTIKIEYFLPWKIEKQTNEEQSLLKRIDGIDLISKTYDKLSFSNLGLGDFWKNPIFMSYGFFTNKKESDYLKQTGYTTAKRDILEKFTNIESFDYTTTCITDLFANFFFIGYLFGAFFFSVILSYIDNSLNGINSSYFKIMFSIYLFSNIIFFEQEFIGIIISIFQFYPLFLITIYFFRPITFNFLLNDKKELSL